MPKRLYSGFTLLEVMMALAILAIAGTAVVGTVRESVVNTQYLAEKRPASWVAENTLTDIVLSGQWPPKNWRKTTVSLSGKEWFVRVRSVATGSRDFRLVEVEVRADKESQSALAHLQTHIYRS